MKALLTGLMTGIVILLGGHVVVATFMPGVVAKYYPKALANRILGIGTDKAREVVAKLEPVKGRPGISQITVLPEVVDRLGIVTMAIGEKHVHRTQRIGAHLLAAKDVPPEISKKLTAGALVVAAGLAGAGDVPLPNAPAHVFAMTPPAVAADKEPDVVGKAGLTANYLGVVKTDHRLSGDTLTVFYELVAGNGHEPGDFVIVHVPLLGDGKARPTVPATATIYDPRGSAWVYANPAPNVFVREAVVIERSDHETAILKKGPPLGTRVAIKGAHELFGIESQIGLERVGAR